MYATYKLTLTTNEEVIVFGTEENIDQWKKENFSNGDYGSGFEFETEEQMIAMVNSLILNNLNAKIIEV